MLILLFLILILVYILPRYNQPILIKSLLSEEERTYIIEQARKDLHVDETAWLNREDPIIKSVLHKCTKYIDRSFVNCENLQVLRYKPGGYYKPHQDTFENDKNMRMYTFILALNDDYEGGETVFPNLKKQYTLEKGDALFFDTVDNYEMTSSKALHGGKPVKSGEKWICNVWVRKYPYTSSISR